ALIAIGIIKYSPFLFQLIFNHGISLKQSDGRVNVLLLGIGGGVHEGPDLTDTIIFSSIDITNNKITMVSIPRDLWMPELKGKINTAYTIGEDKQAGMGLVLAK